MQCRSRLSPLGYLKGSILQSQEDLYPRIVSLGHVNIVLFTWNPDKFKISDRQWNREILQIQDSGFLYGRWSAGNSTRLIKPQDKAFLYRQGNQRGLVAYGTVISDVYQDLSWNEEAEEDELTNYVEIQWTAMLPIEKRLTSERLNKELPYVSWVRQASGTTVESRAHTKLLKLWDETVAKSGLSFFGSDTSSHRARANSSLIQQQSGCCYACNINSETMYQVEPAHLLFAYRGPGEAAEVALCPNCLAIATAKGANLTIAQLERRIAMTF